MKNAEDIKSELKRLQKREKELQEALEESQASSQAKSEFIANISHDLRTPLNAILSYSRFGLNKIDRIDREKILKYFGQIEISGKKLQSMLDKLVDLSKLESGRMAFQTYTCKLSTIVQSLEKDLKVVMEQKNVDLKVIMEDKVDTVSCDQNKIAQVMRTLLTNAVENAPEGSSVFAFITLKKSRGQEGTELKICFKDSRREPLPEEMVANIDSYLNKEKIKIGNDDMGMNLAICNEIIKQHRGKLWAEQEADGSQFCFTLPTKYS